MTPIEFVTSLIDSFAANDKAQYFGHFHPQATFLFHDTPGRVQSRADYETMWAGWEQDTGFKVLRCASSGQRVQEYDDLAVFTHDVHTVRLINGVEDEVYERETIVLMRQGDRWTCLHEHLSPDPGHITS
jgi:SnoaL-like domain